MERKRILVIEEEAILGELCGLVLDETDHLRSRVINHGSRALATARIFSPDVIFLDLELTDCHGREILKQLESDPMLLGVPIVVMTNSMTKEQASEATLVGRNVVLAKPFSPAELRDCAGASLARTSLQAAA